MGSTYGCSEAGLTAKKPFRDLLTEEGRLLKIFLQVSCWPSAASLAFKYYLFVVPKTKAKYSVQSKLQTRWPSLSPVFTVLFTCHYIYIGNTFKRSSGMGSMRAFSLLQLFWQQQLDTEADSTSLWEVLYKCGVKKQSLLKQFSHFNWLRNCMAHSTNGSGRGTFSVKLFQVFFGQLRVLHNDSNISISSCSMG